MIRYCPECQMPFFREGGIYCSQPCASRNNAKNRIYTEEDKQVIQQRNIAFWNNMSTEERNIYRLRIAETTARSDVVAKRKATQKAKTEEKIRSTPTEELSDALRRRKVTEEQDNKCARCGLYTWLDNPLTLELEHIDGNHQNNIRKNLIAICPNCHSLTPTWRGRNKRVHATNEQIKHAILTTPSLRQALLSLGMTGKGGNYKRIKILRDEVFGTPEEIRTLDGVSPSD